MSKEKLKIVLSDWDYTCGDGCCHEWGVSCKINGESIDSIYFASSNDVANGLEVVLKHLGYEVEIDFEDED
jgi:hypothetical protein